MLQVMKDIISEFKQNQSIQTSGDDSGKKISYVPDEIVLNIPVSIEPFTVRFANMLTGWTSTFSMQVNNDNTEITKELSFKNYYKTMAFVNAIAWMAHQENHHPDLEVSYNKCVVRYSTHAINGLSENDFICAAKIDQIVA